MKGIKSVNLWRLESFYHDLIVADTLNPQLWDVLNMSMFRTRSFAYLYYSRVPFMGIIIAVYLAFEETTKVHSVIPTLVCVASIWLCDSCMTLRVSRLHILTSMWFCHVLCFTCWGSSLMMSLLYLVFPWLQCNATTIHIFLVTKILYNEIRMCQLPVPPSSPRHPTPHSLHLPHPSIFPPLCLCFLYINLPSGMSVRILDHLYIIICVFREVGHVAFSCHVSASYRPSRSCVAQSFMGWVVLFFFGL